MSQFRLLLQLASLSINTAATDFRLTTFAGAEENAERIANAGLIKTDFKTPDFGDAIWEYSAEFGSKKSRFNDEEIERSATSAHYVAMMKRWANSKVRDRIKAETGRKAIRVYQQLLSSTRLRDSEYQKAG